MKHFLLKSTLLLFALIVGSSAWATTYNFSSIPTTGWSTSGGSQTINGISWTYSSCTYIGESSSRIQIGSKNKPQTTAWTIQTPISAFGSGKAITGVSITAYTTVTPATYDISVGGTSVKSGSLTTSSSTYSATGLNVTSGNIVITLTGSSTSKAMYLSNISVTYDDATSGPVISAPNVNIAYDATGGSIGYTLNNATGNVTASVTSGDDWLTLGSITETEVPFTCSANTETTDRTATVTLSFTGASDKVVTVTQAAAPPKYTVTIDPPEGGTLVVKNGEIIVTNGTKLTVGTVLTIEATADATHKYTSWQYKKGTGNWVTKTTNFTYTIDANDVEIKANFAATYPVNWSVNGSVTTTTRFAQNETITLQDAPADIDGRTFVGWAAETISGTTDEAPTFLTSPTMGTSELTYYAVFAEAEVSGTPVETKTQTLQYDTWTYYGNTADKNSYRLFGADSYIESASFDLSKLTKVIVYGGTFGGDSFNSLTIGDGINTWKDVTVSGSSQTGVNTYTDGTALSGTKKLRITSNSGNGASSSGNGVRISKVEIYTMESAVSYSNYCTTVAADTRTAVNLTSFTADPTTIVKGNNVSTSIANDQAGWTAAYTYESDNTDVATVNPNGVITAVAKGTVNITARLNVSKTDADYKAGATKSMSIEITVVNPSHNVAFYDNDNHLNTFDASVEEGEAITFPAAPTFVGFDFIGWATSEIATSVTEAPTTVTAANMGDADVTYYAVYGDAKKSNVSATFDASDITNTPSSGTRTWKDNDSGIELYISDGQRYTGGTPYTWSVNKSSSADNYLSISKVNCEIKKVVVTVSGADYAVDDYYVYPTTSSTSGTSLTSSVSTNNLVSTLNIDGSYEQVVLWSSSSYQIRATKIEVEAINKTYNGYFTSVSDLGHVNATLGTNGYTTFASTYPLDLTAANLPTGVSAYKASVEGTTVTFTEIDQTVPANTGILLKGTANETVAIPVAASGTAVADNAFEVNAAGTTFTEDDLYYYFGLKKNTLTFALFDPSTIAIPANKAYLKVLKSSIPASAKSLNVVFDETTGISTLERIVLDNEAWYDLQGRKVAQPTKGIYLHNGKKVFIK